MNKQNLAIIFLTSTISLYASGLGSKIIEVGEEGSSSILQYVYNDSIINIVSEEYYRSASFSPNGKFIMILCGSDVIGTISFYNSADGSRIETDYYSGKEPHWKNNSVEFEEVNWWGEGFTISQYQTFTDGKYYAGKQFVGAYHGSDGYKTDPMCPNYRFDPYSNVQIVLESNRRFIESWSKSYITISQLRVFEFDSIDKVDIVILKRLIEINQELINQFKSESETRFLCIDLFNHTYIIMEHAYRKNAITKDDFNTFTMKLLKSLSIDNNILPWLFK